MTATTAVDAPTPEAVMTAETGAVTDTAHHPMTNVTIGIVHHLATSPVTEAMTKEMLCTT